MIAGRLIDMLPAVLVGVSATGCATMSMPGNAVVRPAGSAPVRVDPARIHNDPLQGP